MVHVAVSMLRFVTCVHADPHPAPFCRPPPVIYHEDHFNICFAVVPHIWLQWLPDALLHALMLVIILWKAIATPRSSQTPMLGLLYRDGIMYYSTTLVILVAGILIWRFADLAWIGGPLYVGWVLCQIAMSRLLLSLRSVSAFSARMTAAAKSRPHIRLRMYDSGNSNSNSNNNSNGRLQADPTRHYSMTPASSVENHRYPLETFYRSGTVMSTRSTTTNASNEDGATLVHHDSYAVYRDGKESPDGGGGKDRERHEYGHGHGHGENGDMARNENRLLSPLGSSPRYERQGRAFVREVHSHSEPEPVYLSPGGGGRGGGRGRRREGVDDSYSDHHPTVRRIASRAELEEDLTRARTRVGNYGTPVPPRQRLRNLWWWLIGRELDGTNGNGNENEETDVDGMMMVGVEEDANALGGIYRCPTTNPPRRTRRGLVVVRDARVCVDAAEVERWDPEDDRGPGVKDSRLGRYDHWL
ncbi:hypothetical protein FRC19_008239 [Serendipita sp. 401]|nr:hypothetical protein FRC19_008239 [Serendipita sp. 401]